DMADRITITFNQPMIPLSSQDQAATNVPVRLSPKVEGAWRWMGTQTLVFDPGSGKRLPMATEYTLTSPAGVKAVSGASLAADVVSTVRTPAPRVLSSGPQGDSQPRDPALWLLFDQKVDPAALLAKTKVTPAGVSLRLATDAERKAVISRIGGGTPTERIAVFKPVAPLPSNAPVQVELAAGAGSLEGPRTTAAPHRFGFRTFAPLTVRASRCSWGDEPCQPDNPWWFEFNNELDAEAFDPAWVTVEPALPSFSATVQGNQIVVNGIKKGRTDYRVTLSPRIVDIHGQTLGTRRVVDFKIGPAEPGFLPPSQPFVVADPGAPARVVFRSRNLRRFRVRLQKVSPEQWDSWIRWQSTGRKLDGIPGTRVSDKDVMPGGGADNWTESGIDLGPALENGLGNVLVYWDAAPGGRWRDNHITGAAWVQVSKV
ncbi:MAG: Ig-like domain-containing protein, partial [Armatimonadaceae bacterium]